MTQEDTLSRAFRQRQVAHLAIDLQRFYCEPEISLPVRREDYHYGHAQRLVAAVDDFADAVRPAAQNVWVTHNRDEQLAREVLWDNGILPKKIQALVPGWLKQAREISGRKKPDSDIIKDKKSFNAFAGTDLGYTLYSRNITTLLLTGLFKDCCVLETAKHAKELGFQPVIVEDLSIWSPFAHKPGYRAKTETREKLEQNDIPRLRSGQVLEILRAS